MKFLGYLITESLQADQLSGNDAKLVNNREAFEVNNNNNRRYIV